MKLQNLAIILVIIILPITLIITAYTKIQIDTIAVQTLYQTKLKDATYDAVSAFQLNTVKNTYSTVSDSIRRDIEAAIQTFIGDLAKSMGVSAANAEYIKPYIPAIVFTLYDGFYIYAPSYNYTELDEIDQGNLEVRNGYTVSGIRNTNSGDSKTTQQISTEQVRQDLINKKGKQLGAYEHVLKPYIYYTVRYKSSTDSNVDITVNYSLDNYVVIYGYDKKGNYFTKAGYLEVKSDKEEVETKETLTKNLPVTTIAFTNNLLNKSLSDLYDSSYLDCSVKEIEVTNDRLRLDRIDNGYTYETINGSNKIKLRNGTEVQIINGTQVELTEEIIKRTPGLIRGFYDKTKSTDANKGYKTGIYDLGWYVDPETENYYVEADSAYKYYNGRTDENGLKYEGAVDFTKWINEHIGPYIKASDARKSDGSKYKDFGEDYIFNINSSNDPQVLSSVFNQHKRAVIRESIQDNLSQAIASYSQNSEALRTTYNFRMPILSELEWSQVLEDPCMITFLQGFKAGTKIFNDYTIVPNTKTKDYVSPDSIYYINSEGGDGYYHKLSCNHLGDNNIVGYRNYDFDRQSYEYKVFKGDDKGNIIEDGKGPLTDDKTEYYYMHMYNNGVTEVPYQACYYCMVNSTQDGNAVDWRSNDKRLKAYYTALAREKYNFYKTNEYLNDQQVKRIADSRIGAKITEEDYGTPIEYSVTINGTKLSDWRIFYNDGKNVYIIYDHIITDLNLIPSQMGVYNNSIGGISWNNDVYNARARLMNTAYWGVFATGPGGSRSATGGPLDTMWDAARQKVDITGACLTVRNGEMKVIGNGNDYQNIDIKNPDQKVGFRPVVKLNANVAFVKGGNKITMR